MLLQGTQHPRAVLMCGLFLCILHMLAYIPTKSLRTSLSGETGLAPHTPRTCAEMCCKIIMLILIHICVLMQMPGTERQDLLQLMTAKGLRIRTDTYEILLKKAAEGSSAG